jgi:hypothetical protein
MMDSADPFQGWSVNSVFQKLPPAKNDLYGGLSFYIRDILLQFCHRIRNLNVNFRLVQHDARVLPDVLNQSGMGKDYFDRIEVVIPLSSLNLTV